MAGLQEGYEAMLNALPITRAELEKLRTLARRKEYGRFFEHAQDRAYAVRSTTVDRIMGIADIGRNEALEFARNLSSAKVGTLKLGRRGGKSRLDWTYTLASIGRVALGKSEELERIADSTEQIRDWDQDDKSIEDMTLRPHRIFYCPLRNYTASLRLPGDLTRDDIDRLTKFIKNLPTSD